MRERRLIISHWKIRGIFVALILANGCSHEVRPEDETTRAWISKLVIQSLHYRRPLGASADPKAGPGGIDYQSEPLPDSRFDCKPRDELFGDLKISEIRHCLGLAKRTNPDFILSFALQKTVRPSLDLVAEDRKSDSKSPPRPPCLDDLLKSVPVPREIFFQGLRQEMGEEQGELGCYAAGIDPEKDPLLGFRIQKQVTVLRVPLRRLELPTNDADTRLLLLSWVLEPFWDEQRDLIPAKAVPDRLCRLCIGEDQLTRSRAPTPPLWPVRRNGGADDLLE